MSTPPANPTKTGIKRTRGRSGCLNCRARRKKCDESKPTCSRCLSANDTCKWDEAFPFRSIGIDAEHPSMLQSKRQKRKSKRSELQIIDMSIHSNSSKRRKTKDVPAEHSEEPEGTGGNPDDGALDSNHNPTVHRLGDRQLISSSLNTHETVVDDQQIANTQLGRDDHTTAAVEPVLQHSDEAHLVSPTSLEIQLLPTPNVQDSEQTDLGTLDFLTSHISNIDMLASAVQVGDIATWSPENEFGALHTNESLAASSPDLYSTYYPNAQYRELHSTLHQHMVETARNTALNRHGSPEPSIDHVTVLQPARYSIPTDSSIIGTRDPTLLRCELVSPRRQLELWRNYLDEIAPWLDMFDNNCHFQSTIPVMAKAAPHLHYSILALSSRQIERRSTERSYTESLGLYQQAIQMIVHRLGNLETEVIAACVLLCVLEMMSSSPRAWARHLDGCAMLLEAAGINGAIGGVGQAVFWCFARMDLWGGYLGDTITKIPTNRWFIPSGSMATAVSQFKDGSNVDTYANYAVFLCGSVINVISIQEVRQASSRGRVLDAPDLYSTRWKALYDLLEDWYNDRPRGMIPLMNEQTAAKDYQNPFPIVLYATSPGVSGNQMYHAGSLLMLQHKPKGVRLPKSRKSILWHARQICGIAVSNADHSAWTNALQPLWMAGKVMSHPSEHEAILQVLSRIEKETGFATEWRANDLKEYWDLSISFREAQREFSKPGFGLSHTECALRLP